MKGQIHVIHIGDNTNHLYNSLGIDILPNPQYLTDLEKRAVSGILEMKADLTELENRNGGIIKLYYDTVDSEEIDYYRNLYQLYGDNICYNRCDLKLEGKRSFITFFEERFKNLKIKHEIDAIVPFGNKAYVKGSFKGKNIRLNKEVSGSFMDIYEFSEEQDINKRRIVNRKTYLGVEVLQEFYKGFQMKLIKESDIIETEVIRQSQNEVLTLFNCLSEGNDVDISFEYWKHKFMKLGYGIETISGFNGKEERVEMSMFMNCRKGGGGKREYFDSSVGIEFIS